MTMKRTKLAKGFFDTETNLEYSAGDMYPRYLEPTPERVTFLREHGVFEEVDEGIGETFEKPTDKNTVDEIKGYLDQVGIEYDKAAKKADLLALITD
ncbi:hypothetical protein [Weissella cibaria]|uniref:hypothetical protein n=1 Tax=Weissella cibaria TaxID=137591 RepID=UPI003D36963F